MKYVVSTLISVLTFAAPLAAHASPRIDLKKIIKDNIATQNQTPAATPASGNTADSGKSTPSSNAAGRSNRPSRNSSEGPDSTEVSAVLAKLKLPDIAGIKIGMHIDEARRLALKANPNFKFKNTDLTWMSSSFNGVEADVRTTWPGNSYGSVEKFVLLYNEAGTVFMVLRAFTSLPSDKAIPADVLQRSVAAKFDAQGIDNSTRPDFLGIAQWRYDMNGKLSMKDKGPNTDSPCQGDLIPGAPVVNAMLLHPSPNCALNIMVSAYPAPKSGLVESYAVSMAAPWLVHDLDAVNAKAAGVEAKRRAEQDKAKGNVPQL
ncbi:hypothetical protein H8L32_11540 [Undibacterium sp. CY18W]|uniref:Uncharacterized protein n=1 Tax=Undibacterium hunanense TaxID=2762292 RepID=A0ABR6ZQE3_9BURK|nr:hypothetical protein [Undibacterium hunanense]MBC3918112.1 hypothetical protein [Undibacterium hunanense]